MTDTAWGDQTAACSPPTLTTTPLAAPWWAGAGPLGLVTPNAVATHTPRTETAKTPMEKRAINTNVTQRTDDQTDTDHREGRDR